MHRHAMGAADMFGGVFEGVTATRQQGQADALGGQGFGAGPAQAAARCADQRVAAFESELHAATLRRWLAAPASGGEKAGVERGV
ncbi:hypothetical protein D3C71_1609040 [compost metagenome]